MKRRILAALTVMALAVIGLAPAKVFAATPPQTDVTGVITEGGNPVVGADVTVVCGGVTETDTSNAQGAYLVIFTTADCPFGSTVKVTAKKGTKMGSASNTVRGITTKLNVAVVNVSIPEFGLIASLTASAAGIGAIVYTRRRKTLAQGV